ncbi:4-hydroxyproline epimerase [Duganella sp. BJB488]|uniref:4-hydroxyproline epimerase n=1 Tax=unclassified Duganella TaxID=2636909 RepID=UPI000E351725|nr:MULTISPECIES: 4-hydroxyproline epimerase [unclassified Duganella]RFP26257.1 4-hydroxyproline epimerase [Duganella sp. BJB489]RFP28002.1 4-hydroxyproline epimerase [Duganella sp. BJB488]RFP37189.1 4-hydroxyproline epimerase [Duganella sp. BJB480]
MKNISIIDSHTGGEPTRLVIDGGPELRQGPLSERLALLKRQHDTFRSAVVCEPRGSDVLVGALLCEPHAPDCAAGVIFFNNVGYLGMCGHGTIGLVASLAYMGRIGAGRHRIDTPVGVVEAELHEDGSVTVDNVASYRSQAQVTVEVPGHGPVTGDVAWGGNWFFLVSGHGLELGVGNVEALTAYSVAVGAALERAGITGADGALIDHIELFAPSRTGADSQSFVLCPGKAYDRSPCGTGTSAKLACLAADGKLAEGALWKQESVIGSVFEASYRYRGEQLIPSIRGRAWVNSQAQLILDPTDPFVWGIR